MLSNFNLEIVLVPAKKKPNHPKVDRPFHEMAVVVVIVW